MNDKFGELERWANGWGFFDYSTGIKGLLITRATKEQALEERDRRMKMLGEEE